VGLAFAAFALLNIALFSLVSLWPGLIEFLWLSGDRPWGIVTSNFVHRELPHLASNLEGFTLASGFFVLVCMVLRPRDRRRWSTVFLRLVFLSGIIGSAIEYPILLKTQDVSYGASGMVYGALGVLLAACLRSLPAQTEFLAKERRRRARRRGGPSRLGRKSLRTLPSVMSLALLASLVLLIFTSPAAFLSVAPDVDVLAHGLGFLLGFLPAIALLRLDLS
jgi:membrane associated rhomboid family serine protease